MNKVSDFLKVFIPAFLLFTLVGAVAGYDARQQHVLQRITYDIQVNNQQNVYSLLHICDINKKQYHYAVDTNTWQVTGSLLLVPSSVQSSLSIPSARFKKYYNIVVSLLGGATGGISLQSAFNKPAKVSITAHIKKSIVGVIGGISGYSFGYWLGSNYDTECDSSIYTTTLNQKENWLQMEKTRLLMSMNILENIVDAHLSVTGNAIYDWQKDPAFMCSDKLKGIKLDFNQKADIKIDDPTSEHFSLINKMAQFHSKIAATQAYQTLIEHRISQAKQLTEKINKDSPLGNLLSERKVQWDQACEVVGEITL